MRGWTWDGTEVELTQEQAAIVRGLLTWHEDGTPFTLPYMGRQRGKTTVLATVRRYIEEGGGRVPDPPPGAH